MHTSGVTPEREVTERPERNRRVGGILLIAAGVFLLATQIFSLSGTWVLIFLGLGFTAAGIATRAPGWFIPGGVLNGIGLGALLTESGVAQGDPAEGGLFLLAFALGWVSIYLFTRFFTREALSWALIPAAVMALIGTPLLFGAAGEAALAAVLGGLNYVWPVVLIVIGVALLLRGRRRE
jgi:hypothetical protein